MNTTSTAVPAITARHPFLERLARREPMTAFCVKYFRTPEIARFAQAAGYDHLWIDTEHSAISLDDTLAIANMAAALGVVPAARVAAGDFRSASRLLDGGMQGLLFPHVETAEDAAAAVDACRYPPRGHRSSIPQHAVLGYARLPMAQLQQAADRAVYVQVILENRKGVENAEAIASLDGVDIISVGSNDLCADLGVPGEYEHPRLHECYHHLISVCSKAGKPLIVAGLPAPVFLELVTRGVAPIAFAGADGELLLGAMRETAGQASAGLKSLG